MPTLQQSSKTPLKLTDWKKAEKKEYQKSDMLDKIKKKRNCLQLSAMFRPNSMFQDAHPLGFRSNFLGILVQT